MLIPLVNPTNHQYFAGRWLFRFSQKDLEMLNMGWRRNSAVPSTATTVAVNIVCMHTIDFLIKSFPKLYKKNAKYFSIPNGDGVLS
jgi:hypothetical protein